MVRVQPTWANEKGTYLVSPLPPFLCPAWIPTADSPGVGGEGMNFQIFLSGVVFFSVWLFPGT